MEQAVNLARVITLERGIADPEARELAGPVLCVLLYCLAVRASGAGGAVNVVATWLLGALVLRALLRPLGCRHGLIAVLRVLGYSLLPLVLFSPVLVAAESPSAAATRSMLRISVAWFARIVGVLWASVSASVSLVPPTLRHKNFLGFWPILILHIFLLSLRSPAVVYVGELENHLPLS